MTHYVQRVLGLYRSLPHTLGHVRRSDRDLARRLERDGVPLEIVEAALRLACLRRLCRPPESPPLPAIRSLHYVNPVLDELRHSPPDPLYLRYLELTLQRLTNPPSP